MTTARITETPKEKEFQPDFLKDDVVRLRKPSQDADLDSYLEFVNDVGNLTWLDKVGVFPFNKEDLKAYIAASGKNIFLFIHDKEGAHVGNLNLSFIDMQYRSAQLGILVSRRHAGKGYGPRACRLLIRHAFEVLNLHRIWLGVIDANAGAVKMWEKLGFVKEGAEDEAFLYNFKYYDALRYRMLEADYRRLKEKGLF